MKLKQRGMALGIAGVLLWLMTVCTSGERGYNHTYHYQGETSHYNVEAWERVILNVRSETCLERIIVLRAKPGLHPYETVSYVRAVDHGCNDRINYMRFRDPVDEQHRGRDKVRLEQDILFAFYTIKPLR